MLFIMKFPQIERAGNIEQQLKSHVARTILEQCTNCSKFSESYIKQGVFVCAGHPQTVTYRSSLVNPFLTVPSHALSLLKILQDWISLSPSLQIDWLLVRINPSCPAAVQSLDVDECESSSVHGELNERVEHVLKTCVIEQLGDELCMVSNGM